MSKKKEKAQEAPKVLDNRSDAERAFDIITQKHGAGSIFRMGVCESLNIEVVSTGDPLLDCLLGIWGLPYGRIVEFYGKEQSGKTTLLLQTIANAQKQKKLCAVVDAEHALDIGYAKSLGVDVNNLLLSQPDNGEQALTIVEDLIRAGAKVVAVDSVAALTPKAEIEGEIGDSHVGLQARMMSQAMRKLTALVDNSKTLLIFTNQLRSTIMSYSGPTTTGGNALKYYASIRLDMRALGDASSIKVEEKRIGGKFAVKVVKNKLSTPFKEGELTIIYGKGFSKGYDLIELGLISNVVGKSGSWFSYKGERLGQGQYNASLFIESNPELYEKIYAEAKQTFKSEIIPNVELKEEEEEIGDSTKEPESVD